MQDTGSEARIHLPIEGHTRWPFIMRVMAFGSVVTVLGLGVMVMLFLVPHDSGINPVLLMGGVFLFLLAELAVMRFAVIPLLGDYGRFRIAGVQVDLFPLSPSGFSVIDTPVSLPITAYKGVALKVANGQENGVHYDVFLDHAQRSKTIRVRGFTQKQPAEDFARVLAETLGVRFLPLT